MTSAADTMPQTAAPATDLADTRRLVRLHGIISLLFLVVASELILLAYGGVAWPDVFSGTSFDQYLTYGRTLPMAINAVVFGWLTIGLVAATYFFLPRLVRSDLAFPMVAAANGVLMAAGVGVGVVAIGMGENAGGRMLEMPWFADVALAVSFLVFAVIVTTTVRRSNQPTVGVPVWYFIASSWWLFLAYSAGAIPGLTGAPAELQSAFSATALTGMWIASAVVGGGYALIAHLIPEAEFHPRLGRIGFWSLGFLWAWTAARTLQYGPTPDWIETIPVLFSAGLLVAVLAIVTDFALAVSGKTRELMNSASLRFFALGVGLFLLIPGHMLLQSFRSSSVVARFTSWENAFDLMVLFGAFTLCTVGLVGHVLKPGATRRVVARPSAWLMILGILFAIGTRWVAGLQQGFTWLAGAETNAYANTGDGFFNTVSPLHGTDVLTFIGLAVFGVGVLLYLVGLMWPRRASVDSDGGASAEAPDFSWPDEERPLVVRRGAAAIFALVVVAVFALPAIDSDREATALADESRNLEAGSLEALGRDVYVAEGCWYCHTQQVRAVVSDVGLGPVSAPGDFAYDPPGIFGVARIGPDLAHAGSREPTSDAAWVELHLTDPRAERPWSTMPAYGHLNQSDLSALAAYVAGLE